MNQILELHDWLQTPSGELLRETERALFADALVDVFGYHALQLGFEPMDALEANRMPQRWLALDAATAARTRPANLVCDFAALPFAEASLDLVVMPHTLEFCAQPHEALREVERVLVPEGRAVIAGFNPTSWWGARQARARLSRQMGFGELFLPSAGEFIGYRRLRDWLRLLGFEVESAQFSIYRPPLKSQAWIDRWAFMERLGPKLWPGLGALYFVVAVKRVRGARMIGAKFKKPSFAPSPVPVVGRVQRGAADDPMTDDR